MAVTGNISLRWYADRSCWRFRPKIRGKTRTFYVGKGATGEKDTAAYARAIQEAQEILEQQQRDEESLRRAAAEAKEVRQVYRDVKVLNAFFDRPASAVTRDLVLGKNLPPMLQHVTAVNEMARRLHEAEKRVEELEAILAASGRAAKTRASATLAELADRFIEVAQKDLRTQRRSSAHIRSFKTNVIALKTSLEEMDPPVKTSADLEARPEVMAAYREVVIEQQADEDLTPAWSKGRLDKARLFCEWLVRHGYLSRLPPSIDRAWSKVGKCNPDPRPLSLEEVRKIWKAADDRHKLVIILFLNCGYRGVDVQSLEREHINMEKGEIRRQRHKTGTWQIHKLWPETKRRLQA